MSLTERQATPEQLDNLRHMLGIGSHLKKRFWGYRNYFCACPGTQDYRELEEMERLGLVIRGRSQTESVYFHCTEAGCKAAGLPAATIRRTLYGE